jgi:serine protease Do
MSRAASFLLLAIVIVCSGPTAPLQAQDQFHKSMRSDPKFLRLFHDVVQQSSQSIVRIQCNGLETCLGVVGASDGWVLTKAHDLTGKITCELSDGRTFDANLVGVHQVHDLALLKIAAKQLKPITWSHSNEVRAGSWVASVGMSKVPVAVGVISVPTRKVHEAYLGIQVESRPDGLFVLKLVPKSPAGKAGVLPDDLILRVDGQRFTDTDAFSQYLAGHRPGDVITLTIRRGAKDRDIRATLERRDQGGGARADFQNRLGSELSNRRTGYAVILQHDSVLKPSDCGGPLVDLQGRVVGINISRAGRVESWAIPAEVAQPLIQELQSGRFAPLKAR